MTKLQKLLSLILIEIRRQNAHLIAKDNRNQRRAAKEHKIWKDGQKLFRAAQREHARASRAHTKACMPKKKRRK